MDFVKLKEICNFEKGSTGLAKAEPGDYPLVATGADRKTCNSYQFDTKAVCIPLVSSTGHGHASLKNVHYQKGKFALGTILVALTSKDESKLNIQFLHLYLSQLKDQILVPLMSGAANVALSVRKIQNVEIPLPPIERQREIVENFKSIVAEEGELKSELTRQQTLLKKLRQQILQEAIEGKLTADWRAQNPDIEPASKLLERIAAEKAQLIKEKKIKKQIPLPPICEEERPIELPEGWMFARPAECVINEPYTLGIGPFGSDLVVSDYTSSGVPLIFVKNITNNNFDMNSRYVSVEKYKQLKAHAVSPGFIVITKMGDPPGTATIYHKDNGEKGILTADCIKFGVNKLLNNKYMLYAIQSNLVQSQLGSLTKGMGRKKLSLKRFKTVKLPIPSFEEQKIIVAQIEKLLILCDQLETQITQNQIHAEQLMQAVLKEAFQSEQSTKSDQPETSKPIKTKNRNNVIPLKPTGVDYYKRTLLAAEIVHQLHRQPTLGHLKLQKLIYLCQKTEQMQLPTNFLQQAAGPYDPKMARSIHKQLKDKKWFLYQREKSLKYVPLEDAGEHRADFDKYFAQQKKGIHTLINLFRSAKSDQMEIVATLYACWERLLQEGADISNEHLIEHFYQWSEEKAKYPPERLATAIEWMSEQGIVPSSEKNSS